MRACLAGLTAALLLSAPAIAQNQGQNQVQPAQQSQNQPPEPDQAWIPRQTAELQALDKVTARITILTAKVGTPIRFGSLTITVHACDARPPEEVQDAAAYLEVRDSLAAPEAPPAFRGWMLANTPAANMLEHPVYDLRILECR